MTVHQQFKRRRARLLLAAFLCLVLLGLGCWAGEYDQSDIFSLLIFVTLVGAALCYTLINFACKCPRCRKFIMTASSTGGMRIPFPQFCPHCRLDLTLLDAE